MSEMSVAVAAPQAHATSKANSRYKYYALFVLVLVGAFNSADRGIISVLALAIKADLGVGDAQIAFLYGTAFVTLYTLLGLPAAGLSDRMSRPRLLGGGLALWSCFTAMGGFVTTYAGLAFARFGVGIGEATANPVSHSLVCDYFPARQRARALATYLTGLFLGAAAAAMIGGYIIDSWSTKCSSDFLCSFRPWQAAFLIVGLPGLLLAVAVATLREPVRGASDGQPTIPPATGHWREAWQAFLSVLPIVSTCLLYRKSGVKTASTNAAIAATLLAVAALLAWMTGDVAQWLSVFIGANAIVSWVQFSAIADPGFVRLTVGTPAFRYAVIGYSFMGGIVGAVHFWKIPYAVRAFGLSAGEAGMLLAPVIAIGSLIGTIGGGFISDAWRARDPRGYLWWSMTALALIAASLLWMVTARTITVYVIAGFFFMASSASWSSAAAAQAQELVLPRMRSTTAAINALTVTLVSMALGPYASGKVGELTGSLHWGLGSLLLLVPFGAVFLVLASRSAVSASETKFQRAGEDA